MKIRLADIKGFGKLSNKKVLFHPGFNVIYGCNESGKSTLRFFIKGLLYGLKGGRKTKEGTLPPLKQFKPWIGNGYGGTLEYELDNGQIFIVNRNFDKNTVTIHDAHSNPVMREFPAGKEEGVKFAEMHLGLSESCFERSALIGQLQSVVDGEGKKILSERLMNIGTSADEEISLRKAVKVLKDAQLSYVGSERSTTRPLNLIESQMREALEQERKSRLAHENYMDSFLELEQVRREAQKLDQELKSLLEKRGNLEYNERLKQLEQTYCHVAAYYKQVLAVEDELAKIAQKLENATKELEPVKKYEIFSLEDTESMISDDTRYRFLLEEHKQMVERREQIERKYTDAQRFVIQYICFAEHEATIEAVVKEILHKDAGVTPMRADKAPMKRKVRNFSLAGLIIGAALITGFFFFGNMILEPLRLPLMIAGCVLTASMAGIRYHTTKYLRKTDKQPGVLRHIQARQKENWQLVYQWMAQVDVADLEAFLRLRSKYEENKQRLAELGAEKKRLDEKETNHSKQIQELEEIIASKLKKAGMDAEYLFSIEQVQSWHDELKRYQAGLLMYEALVREQALCIYRKQGIYKEISVYTQKNVETLGKVEEILHTLKQKLPDGTLHHFNEQDLSVLDEQIFDLHEKIRHNELQGNTLATRLENIPDEDKLRQAHHQIQELSLEREERLLYSRSLEAAIEGLMEASTAIQRDYVPYLNEEMGVILSKLTAGRYETVKADDNLLLNLISQDSVEWVIPEQLSMGAADQVYLALRLAIIRLVEKNGERIPLFLDEPFAQYDETRTAEALKLLLEESKVRQIFLFTCKKREVELTRQLARTYPINVIEIGL